MQMEQMLANTALYVKAIQLGSCWSCTWEEIIRPLPMEVCRASVQQIYVRHIPKGNFLRDLFAFPLYLKKGVPSRNVVPHIRNKLHVPAVYTVLSV